MEFEIVFDREEDRGWIAEIESLPGVLAYGVTQTKSPVKGWGVCTARNCGPD